VPQGPLDGGGLREEHRLFARRLPHLKVIRLLEHFIEEHSRTLNTFAGSLCADRWFDRNEVKRLNNLESAELWDRQVGPSLLVAEAAEGVSAG
jgi:hypothetical protein